MSDKKAKTMDLKGNDYARVPERLKIFREDCPNGSIKTEPKFLDDGQVLFVAYILKDKSDLNSADATGHALGKLDKDKALERLETISVGRALAILGYLASGEVASSEEMEDFNAYRETQKQEAITLAIDVINDASTIEELRTTFMSLGTTIKFKEVQQAKDARKAELTK